MWFRIFNALAISCVLATGPARSCSLPPSSVEIMSQQQLVLEPLGIVTEPNKLGQIPAGALSVMTDCVERSPGVIENIQAWQTKVTVAGADVQTTAMFAVPMDGNLVVVIYNVNGPKWVYRWYDLSTGSA